jgi:hypothetical protein
VSIVMRASELWRELSKSSRTSRPAYGGKTESGSWRVSGNKLHLTHEEGMKHSFTRDETKQLAAGKKVKGYQHSDETGYLEGDTSAGADEVSHDVPYEAAETAFAHQEAHPKAPKPRAPKTAKAPTTPAQPQQPSSSSTPVQKSQELCVLLPSELLKSKYLKKVKTKSGKWRYIYTAAKGGASSKKHSFRSIIEGDHPLSKKLWKEYDKGNGSDAAMQQAEDRFLKQHKHLVHDDRGGAVSSSSSKKGKGAGTLKAAAKQYGLDEDEARGRITDAFMDSSSFYDGKMHGDTEAVIGFVEDSDWNKLQQVAKNFKIDLRSFLKGNEEDKGKWTVKVKTGSAAQLATELSILFEGEVNEDDIDVSGGVVETTIDSLPFGIASKSKKKLIQRLQETPDFADATPEDIAEELEEQDGWWYHPANR